MHSKTKKNEGSAEAWASFVKESKKEIKKHDDTSSAIGVWEMKLEIMTDRPADQPTERLADRVIGKIHFQ